MTAQFSGAGAAAERVAAESVDRFRLCRAPHVRCKLLAPDGAHSTGRALEYFRRVAEQTDSVLARAVAAGRELICEFIRALHTPHVASRKGLASPGIHPEGLACALGVLRTLSRLVKGAARVETPS